MTLYNKLKHIHVSYNHQKQQLQPKFLQQVQEQQYFYFLCNLSSNDLDSCNIIVTLCKVMDCTKIPMPDTCIKLWKWLQVASYTLHCLKSDNFSAQ